MTFTPPPDFLGTWGHRTEYDLAGNVVYAPLEWYRGGAPIHAFARSQILDAQGDALEYWIELTKRGCKLTADTELMRDNVESHRDVAAAIASANRIERIHRVQLRLRSQAAPTQTAGQPGKGTP